MVTRRILAGLLLLSLCCPVAASLATQAAVSSCSKCAKACCCAPGKTSGPCRIERPCGPDAAPQATTQSVLKEKALVAVAEELLQPVSAESFSVATTATALDPVRIPLDPPPRLSP